MQIEINFVVIFYHYWLIC